MKTTLIKPYEKDGLINAVIETPRGSQNKFTYDPGLEVFRLKKTLPMGTVFPFDFGFIPNTEAEDGDPVDVLIIMEEPTFPGCLVECRLLGVLEASQKEKGDSAKRNDRLVAVASKSVLYSNVSNIKDLNTNMITEIENFFIDYNKHEGKKFKPLRWGNMKKALALIKEAVTGK